MKSLLFVLAILLLLAGGVSVAAADDCGCTFQVDTRNGPQTLGGKSPHDASHEGLHRAAENSGGVITHVADEPG